MVAVQRLRSTEGYVAVDLDYRVYARGADPTRLLVVRCGSCCYAEYVTDFKKRIDDTVRGVIESNEYKTLVSSDRASDFPLVAAIKIAKKEPHERVGYCFLRASWFSGDLGRIAEERAFLNEAAVWFRRAIEADSVFEQEKDRTFYLLAEINRRLENFSSAENALNRITAAEFSGLVRDERNLIATGDAQRRRIKAR